MMDRFNQTISSFEQKTIDRPIDGNLEEMFRQIFFELRDRLDLLENSSLFQKQRNHLLAKVNQLQIDETVKQHYLRDIEQLQDYVELLMFLEQQIKGY